MKDTLTFILASIIPVTALVLAIMALISNDPMAWFLLCCITLLLLGWGLAKWDKTEVYGDEQERRFW